LFLSILVPDEQRRGGGKLDKHRQPKGTEENGGHERRYHGQLPRRRNILM